MKRLAGQRVHRIVADVVSMRKALLCATAIVLCASFPPASAQEPITTPLLSTDRNFRDLAGIAAIYGGTGLADTTSHDGTMRTNVFYRSEHLSALNDTDWATLSSLNIKLDIDLRTPFEILQYPDRVPAGATRINVNIFGTYDPPAVSMEDMYRNFVADGGQRSRFRTVLLQLANSSDPVLYHCEAGKDRTGWTSVILQTIAGVSPTTIMQDYMATNKYTGDPNAVHESYLEAGLTQANVSFGSMDGLDRDLWFSHVGLSPLTGMSSGASMTSAPEPGTLALLAAALLSLLTFAGWKRG